MPEVTGRLRTPRLASAPSSPVAGEMYYDTGTSKLYWWSGSAWVAAEGGAGLPAGGSTGQVVRKTASGTEWAQRTRKTALSGAGPFTLASDLDGNTERTYELIIDALWTGVNTAAFILLRPNGSSALVYAGYSHWTYWDVAFANSGNSWQNLLANPTGLILLHNNWNLGGHFNLRALISARAISTELGRPMQSEFTFRALNASRQDQSRCVSAGYWSENTTNITSYTMHLTQGSLDGTATLRTVD